MMKKMELVKSCKEDWANMKKVGQGRFCYMCSKTVIDFSPLSQQEIIAQLKQSKGRLCARVTRKQLETTYVKIEEAKHKRNHFSKLAVGMLLASTLMASQSCDSQDTPTTVHMVQSVLEGKDDTTKVAQPTSTPNVLNQELRTPFLGTVTSQKTGKPLQDATVTFFTLLQAYQTSTDKNGEFQLEIPQHLIKEENVVRISFGKAYGEEQDEPKRISGDYETGILVLSQEEMSQPFFYEAESYEFYLGDIGFLLIP